MYKLKGLCAMFYTTTVFSLPVSLSPSKKKNHRIEGNKLLGHIYKGSPQAKELNPGNRKELHEIVKNTNEGNRPIR